MALFIAKPRQRCLNNPSLIRLFSFSPHQNEPKSPSKEQHQTSLSSFFSPIKPSCNPQPNSPNNVDPSISKSAFNSDDGLQIKPSSSSGFRPIFSTQHLQNPFKNCPPKETPLGGPFFRALKQSCQEVDRQIKSNPARSPNSESNRKEQLQNHLKEGRKSLLKLSENERAPLESTHAAGMYQLREEVRKADEEALRRRSIQEKERERRKESIRESVKRSRLKKKAETEELARRVGSLTAENLALKSEVNQLKLEKLGLENAALMWELKATRLGIPRNDCDDEKRMAAVSTENLLSRAANNSASVVEEGEATM